MQLRDVVDAGGELEIADLAVVAAAVRPGSVYICVRGFGVDGHDWAAEAVANGAIAVIAERRLDIDAPQLVVFDTRAVLAALSDEFWGRPTETLPVAGVTGTSGKTTTAYLLHSILDAAGLRPGLHGTIDMQIGTTRMPSKAPTPVAFHLQRFFREMLDAGNRSCVIEATSHDSDLQRLDTIRFAVLVFTNLGHDHLDYHGTFENYFEAKRRLFLRGEPAAAINVGDPYGARLADELRGRNRVLTFALEGDADVAPEKIQLSPEGARLRVAGLDLETRLLGAFNVENILAAVAAARLLEVSDDAIARGVAALEHVPGRMERIDEGQPFAVFVDYAHKPEALEAVLRTARTLTDGRVLCVFGCGGESYRGKRPLMGGIASSLSDVAILTTDDPRDEAPQAIVADVLEGATPDVVEPDRRRAIERAIELARPGDVIVVAGRGQETFQKLEGGRTVRFDDRQVVRDLLNR
jgi:UDP-N-acetylmuramoyl-L-alanyl-D-glutamate--2,6-diaminopimelate ligase